MCQIRGHERRRWLRMVCCNRMVNVGQTPNRMLKKSASIVPCLRRSGFAQAGRIVQRLNVPNEITGGQKHCRWGFRSPRFI